MKKKCFRFGAQYSPVATITSLDYDHTVAGKDLFAFVVISINLRFGKSDANYGFIKI